MLSYNGTKLFSSGGERRRQYSGGDFWPGFGLLIYETDIRVDAIVIENETNGCRKNNWFEIEAHTDFLSIVLSKKHLVFILDLRPKCNSMLNESEAVQPCKTHISYGITNKIENIQKANLFAR